MVILIDGLVDYKVGFYCILIYCVWFLEGRIYYSNVKLFGIFLVFVIVFEVGLGYKLEFIF